MKIKCWLCGKEFVVSEEHKNSEDLKHQTCE